MRKSLYLLILFVAFFLSTNLVYSQGERQVILLSGVVVNGLDADPIPGVHLYIPKAGRGTSTNGQGFFGMNVVPGDSIIISSVGFKKRFFMIPKDKTDSYSVVIEMTEDVTNLPIIEVFPYPTEELFKEAVLALELPDEEKMEILRKNLDQQMMTRLAFDLPMDAKMNYRNTMMQDVYRTENQTFLPSLQLLNPFAWAQFIKSIKRGDFKKGKWKDRKN